MSDTFFMCLACGKYSHDKYGLNPISKGWDESCARNSIEVVKNSAGEIVPVSNSGAPNDR